MHAVLETVGATKALRATDRLVLGTAQFGLAYGRRRSAAPLDEREVESILDAAWDAGLRVFDTAEAYGDAALRLERWLRARSRLSEATITTKVTVDGISDETRVRDACVRFAGAASVTLLSHGAPEPWRFADFVRLCKRDGVEYGQSVYTAAEIHEAAHAGSKRVQAPGNVLDVRQIVAAHEAGIPLDVRSVFVQGVLLDPPELAERRAPGAGGIVSAFRAAAREAQLPLGPALVASVLSQLGHSDRVVIGIDAPDQLIDVTRCFELSEEQVCGFLQSVNATRLNIKPDLAILDPRTWPQSP